MADNNFRPFHIRDSLTREDVDPMSDTARDPLAELARIIGQSNRVTDFDRDPRHDAVETLHEPPPATADRDWAADDGYAEPDAPEQYPDQYAEENYVQPRLPEPPVDRAYGRYGRDEERAPAIVSQYSEPAEPAEPADAYDDARDDERAYDARYRDEVAPPPRPAGRQPALAPQSYDDEYEAEDQWDDRADRQSDDAEDYDDEAPARPRRSGLVVVVAMVGLVMVGAGGAFAYRAMFGGAILAPSLPPVIKANDAPNKIVPNRSDAQTSASNQAGAATSGAPEKLVSREEQPVAIQPPNAPPRVVSTIPVPLAPGAAPAGPPVASAMPAVPALPSAPSKVAAPAQPSPAATAGSPEPKKIHTVTIRSDQMGDPNAAAPAPAPAAPAPAARPKATEAPVVRPAPAPKAGANAPLAIVPAAQGAAPAPAAEPPPRSRVARTEAPSVPLATAPAAAPAPAAGGYGVQVTSQRSEAEAQSEFKALQAKFPSQLGNRQPVIHRADLGDKGTFYRALVGPFASSEAAAAMCSNLKAAGGSCIVQKN
jgi:hypothetical protein